MIDQPPTARLLAAVADRLAEVARRSPGESADDGSRYELRVAANLTAIAARELQSGAATATVVSRELSAAASALSHCPPVESTSVGELVEAIDGTVALAVRQRWSSFDGPTAPAELGDQSDFHNHLLRAVERRLDIQRPGYR